MFSTTCLIWSERVINNTIEVDLVTHEFLRKEIKLAQLRAAVDVFKRLFS